MSQEKPNQNSTDLFETTLTSSLVYQGKFLKVIQDEVRLPNDKTTLREYFLHPGASMVVPVLPNGDLVMIEQYRHPLKKVFLEFPAGKKDPGESFETTAARELQEETGYQSDKLELMTIIHPVIGYSDEVIQIYLAEDVKKWPANSHASLDTDEFLNVKIMSFDKLSAMVWAGEITDVKTQIAFFWLNKKLKGEGPRKTSPKT